MIIMYIYNVYNDCMKNYIFYSFLLIFFSPKESENVPFKKDDNDSDDKKKRCYFIGLLFPGYL